MFLPHHKFNSIRSLLTAPQSLHPRKWAIKFSCERTSCVSLNNHNLWKGCQQTLLIKSRAVEEECLNNRNGLPGQTGIGNLITCAGTRNSQFLHTRVDEEEQQLVQCLTTCKQPAEWSFTCHQLTGWGRENETVSTFKLQLLELSLLRLSKNSTTIPICIITQLLQQRD